jgi:NADPH-dependent F420 reductase
MRIAFVGGTGSAGIGLAARLARAGHACAVGSRSSDRAREASVKVMELVAGASVDYGTNAEIIGEADVVLLTVSDDAQRSLVRELADDLAGKIVVSMANPLLIHGRDAHYLEPPEGSLAEAAQIAAPRARVVSAFHEIRVDRWAKLDTEIDADTIVCGDHDEAKEVVLALARDAGVQAVDAGPLKCSRYVEAFVAVLVSINMRNRAGASYRITGLARDPIAEQRRVIELPVPAPLG